MDTKARVYLVRHTETDWNVEGRYSGQSDEPRLTERGFKQAQAVAEALADQSVAHIVVSDLTRARQTARIISERLEKSCAVDRRLREVSLGRMDGMIKEEARAFYKLPELNTRHPAFDFRSIGGESREEVVRRQRELLHESFLRGAPVAFVGHGTSLRILCEDLGIDSMLPQGTYKLIEYPQ